MLDCKCKGRRVMLGLLVSGVLLALSACGGGASGGASGAYNTDVATATVIGTVAVGAPVEGAEVSLRDLEGQIDTTLSDASGGFVFPVDALKRTLKPPLVVHARFQVAGRDIDLFSITTDAAGNNIRINVTPWSDMVTRAYVWPSTADPDALEGLPSDASRLDKIVAASRDMAGALLPPAPTHFIRDPLTPDPNRDPYDALIERTRIRVESGTATLTDVNGRQIAVRSLVSLAGGTSDASDAATVNRSEADGAIAAKGNFVASTAPVVNQGAKVVDAVNASGATVGKPVLIVVSGSNLGRWRGMEMTLQDCPAARDEGGTDTARTFSCTPLSTGTKNGHLVDALTARRLKDFSVDVKALASAAPKVVAVSPASATLNRPATFTVTGTDLGSDLVFRLDGCSNPAQVGGGTATTRWFTCTPGTEGVASGTVATADGAELKTFSISVAAAPAEAPVVLEVSPLTAGLKQPTTYTVTGTNLIDGMRFSMEGCSGQEIAGTGSATRRQFTCTSGLSGANRGDVKDKVDGTVLKSFTVTVTAAAMPTPTVVCTGISPTLFNKYCYYTASNGQLRYHGVFEQYTSAAGTQLTKRETYVDGVLDGPATYWNYEFLDTAFKGTYFKSAEGSYAAGKKHGTWQFYWTNSYNTGVESLGKLSREVTLGLFNGVEVPAVENIYCPYGPFIPLAKRGQLAVVNTFDLVTGTSSTKTFFKNGCDGPD